MELEFGISVMIAVFAIVNPIGNVSFFVALTDGFNRSEKQAIINKAILVSIIVLVLFTLVGNYIFEIFSITIPAFRIAGGILLFTIAFSMLQGSRPKTKLTEKDKEEVMEREAVGIVPLGVPMLAGPGAITTVMIYMAEATSESFDVVAVIFIILAIIVTMVIAYLLLYYSEVIFERIGRVGALAFSRIMGLILAAMAVQFMLSGILDFAIENNLI